MLRKMMMAPLAAVALGALAPSEALARGGFGGGHGGMGGFHGGGFGGFHGGGVAAFRGAPMGGGVAAFRGAPMGGAGFRHAAFIGGPRFVGGVHPGFHPGFRRRAFFAGAVAGALYAAPYGYGYYDGYDPYYAYQDQGYYDGGYSGCALVQQPVRTPYGWQYQTVQVCQ
jgi:hypothetical protein